MFSKVFNTFLLLLAMTYSNSSFGNKAQSIHQAAMWGDVSQVIAFVGSGVDINAKNKYNDTAIYIATSHNHKEVVEWLIKNKADVNVVNDQGLTPINKASRYAYEEIINMLIKAGANLRYKDAHGMTPLHSAAEFGRLETVKLLIKSGSKLDTVNGRGQTLIHAATSSGNLELVKFFLALEFDVNSLDLEHRTPLFYSFLGDVNVTKELLDHGANPNLLDELERPFIHFAVERGNEELISLLNNYNIDLELKNKEGETAIEHARKLKLDSIAELLAKSLQKK
jgi:ankyrin repeat protein